MYIDYTPEQQALRDQLRAYFKTIVTPEYLAQLGGGEGGGPLYMEAVKKLGRDGWLGIGWPKEYGGQGRTPVDQYIFFDEASRAGCLLPTLTINAVAQSILAHGTEEQKKFFLPNILREALHFAIGYTEPSAGTDLASLKTRAVRDGDHWVITGQKVYTSQAEYADYIWLAARTDPTAAPHKGISIFAVSTKSPGYRITPIWTMGSVRTNTTYYDEIRVPNTMLIGQENGGWWLIATQLNRERVSLINTGLIQRLYEEVRQWASTKRLADGRRVIDQQWVQLHLARLHAKIEVLRLLNWKQAWNMEQGTFNMAEASAVKVFGSELNVEGYSLMLEILGQAGTLREGSPDAILHGRVERMYRTAPILTFGGGTNEVQRDIIAMAALGMPRSR